MENLQGLKSRLNAVSTIKKITKAMKLVATSKFQRLKNSYASKKEYYDVVEETLNKIIDVAGDSIKEVFPSEANDSTLYIVVTSDIGMCGAYNSNIIKLFKSAFQKEKDHVIAVGGKMESFTKYNKIETISTVTNLDDMVEYHIISDLTNDVISLIQSGKVNCVKVVYTKYENSVTFNPTIGQLFPFQKENDINESKVNADFEPNAKTILENSLHMFMTAIVYGKIAESKISEMASRRNSMETATDNATDLIESLGLKYNRARQASITQEIVEIVAGSEGE